MSELVLYTSDDGRTRLDLRIEGRTAWLTQLEIAELFQTTKQNVSLHAKNILKDRELAEDAAVKDSLTTAAYGKRYLTRLYNLALILAIDLCATAGRYGGTFAHHDNWELAHENETQ